MKWKRIFLSKNRAPPIRDGLPVLKLVFIGCEEKGVYKKGGVKWSLIYKREDYHVQQPISI